MTKILDQPLSIVEVEPFVKNSAIMDEEDLEAFKYFIALNPESGDIIPETGGFRKVRWSLGGKGKRGGVRVIYYYYTDQMPLFLITIYRKSDKENITKKQAQGMRKLVEILMDHYS